MRMRFACIGLTLLAAIPAFAQSVPAKKTRSISPQPYWNTCRFSSADCAVLQDACGNWIAVNKRFYDDAVFYYGELAKRAKCEAVTALPAPQGFCKRSRCEIFYPR